MSVEIFSRGFAAMAALALHAEAGVRVLDLLAPELAFDVNLGFAGAGGVIQHYSLDAAARVGRGSHGTFGIGVTLSQIGYFWALLGNVFARGSLDIVGGFSVYSQLTVCFASGMAFIMPSAGIGYSWW
jgi:hypothetical protein